MTQYDDRVEQQRLYLEAVEWAKIPKSVHIHQLDSMWYETKESKKFLKNGRVTDIQYNNGIIERKQDGKLVHKFGSKLSKEELVRAYLRGGE